MLLLVFVEDDDDDDEEEDEEEGVEEVVLVLKKDGGVLPAALSARQFKVHPQKAIIKRRNGNSRVIIIVLDLSQAIVQPASSCLWSVCATYLLYERVSV